MPKYVDGFVIPVPEKNVANYKKLSQKAAKIWLEYGALEYKECVGDDMHAGGDPQAPSVVPFPGLLKTKPGETVVFSWIVYKSKADRNRINAKVMSDPRLAGMMDPKKMPFDSKRMVYGGFQMLVDL